MRLDRYLHCIRLVKSRTLAQALIATGHVRIDGKRIEKPSDEVRVGSVVAFPLHDQVRVLKVLSLPLRRGPASKAPMSQPSATLGVLVSSKGRLRPR